MIGIRLADHSVFPVFTSDEPAGKRVVLTTSHNNQERVDIELVRSDNAPAAPAEPAGPAEDTRAFSIGRLSLDDLQSGRGGEPEVDLLLHLTPEGHLEVTATNRVTGNAQSVSIDVDQATADAQFSVPQSLTEGLEPEFAAELHEEPRSRRSGWLLVILMLGVFAAAALGVWWFVLRGPGVGSAEEISTIQQTDEEITLPEEPAESPATESAAEEPPVTDRPAPPITDSDSVEYRIRRGDTLWDLSQRFYGTPWLFSELADANEISNPNLIYAESDLEIPEQLLRRDNLPRREN